MFTSNPKHREHMPTLFQLKNAQHFLENANFLKTITLLHTLAYIFLSKALSRSGKMKKKVWRKISFLSLPILRAFEKEKCACVCSILFVLEK